MVKLLATIEEVADALRVSRSQVYALMESGQLPFVKLPAVDKGKAAKLRRIKWKDVEAYIEKCSGAATGAF